VDDRLLKDVPLSRSTRMDREPIRSLARVILLNMAVGWTGGVHRIRPSPRGSRWTTSASTRTRRQVNAGS